MAQPSPRALMPADVVPADPPSGRAPGPGTVGALVAGRYRLAAAVSSGPRTILWRATDEVLARPVAVKLLYPAGQRERAAFLAAAVRAGSLSDRRLANVLDAGTDDVGSGGGVGYVVSEWVEGRSLAELLEDGPLRADSAVGLVAITAGALDAAATRGVAHGAVHPGNVLVTASGGVKVTDLAVAAAAAGREPAGSDGPGWEQASLEDTRALGALLYATLTARWPDGPAYGLAAAPRDDGRLCMPRQVRAGVPHELDAVTRRALDPSRRPLVAPLRTPAELLAALPRVPAESSVVPAAAPAAAMAAAAGVHRSVGRRLLRAAVPLTLLVLVGLLGWFVGVEVGRLPSSGSPTPALPAPVAPVAGQPAAPVVLTVAGVRDFDPAGDGREQPGSVGLVFDRDPSTAWETDTYKSRRLGGLKPGVGLLVDLGRMQKVGRVALAWTTAGTTVELRVSDVASTSADEFRTVARVADSPRTVALVPTAPTTARYLLVWITELPPAGRGFRAELAEIAVTA